MKRALVLGALFAMILSGCVPVPLPGSVDVMDMPEASARPLTPAEGVVLLAGSASAEQHQIPACLAKTMQEADPTLRIVEAGEVRDALFPWFERATTPDNAEELAAVLRRPLVQEKLASFNLGYFLTVTGGTWKGLGEGVSPEHTGIGWSHRKKHSDLSASVWDLRSGSSPGRARIEVSGSDTVVLVMVVGTWVFTMTEGTACRVLGHRLAAYLTGKQPSELEPVKTQNQQ